MLDEGDHLIWRLIAFEWTTKCRCDGAVDRRALAAQLGHDGLKRLERRRPAHPHVGAIVGLAGRHHQIDFVDTRRHRVDGTAQIRHQGGINHAVAARDAGEHLGGIAQIRDRFRRDERRHLDLGDTGSRQRIDQRDFVSCGEAAWLDLQAVARRDLVDEDVSG